MHTHTHAYFVILWQEQNRLRQWSNAGMELKAETNQGKMVTRPQFAEGHATVVKCHFLLSGT